jgi:PTH1 family peptidyl-tRNA hydrolase
VATLVTTTEPAGPAAADIQKLVVALGNPGPRYARTRHNIGFRVAEHFAARHGIELSEEIFRGRFGRGRMRAFEDSPCIEVGVLEPLTFMNLSGDAVALALEALPVDDPARDLVVVFDDVDLPFARLRVRARGGAGGHRGLQHIIDRLGHKDFPRLRFGVGRPHGEQDTRDHVLLPFDEEEERALPDQLTRACEALETTLRLGAAAAMNLFNRDPAAEA